MIILQEQQIRQKIRRLAIEILERNYGEPEIIFAGLNNNGVTFAQRLVDALMDIKPEEMSITLTRIRLNPANPVEYTPEIEMPADELADKVLILVDDVSNTGRTVFYALRPLLRVLPRRVELAVLVDRKHKMFPIQPDYVGLSLYTTLKDNIHVQLKEGEMRVFLE
ncbi:MAG: phosphoribosyltransferase family protein [Saprospiraceae bacterium]|nr:phosphoribosyltransferase family protein [Saprospiraceae bacterium]